MTQLAQKTQILSLHGTGTKKIVAAIPCLNTQNTIADIVRGARKYVNEVIVVDDGSTDLTASMARAAGAAVMRHDKNRGKGAAMKTAAASADADILVFIDGDGQHDPEDIPKLLEPILREEADFVIGSRFLSSSKTAYSPFVRKTANTLASIVISLIISFLQPGSKLAGDSNGSRIASYKKNKFEKKKRDPNVRGYRILNGKIKWITDCTSGFAATKMDNWHKLSLTSNGYQIETEMVYEQARNGFTIAEIAISCTWKGSLSGLSVVKDGTRTILLLVKKLLNRSNGKSAEPLPHPDLAGRDEYYGRS